MFSKDVIQLADNLIAAIGTDILTDYTYKGTNELYKKEENKVFGFIEELVNDIVYYELADGVNVIDFVMGAYVSHNLGTEVGDVEAYEKAQQEALNKIYSGELVDVLFDKLLDNEIGLYRIIEGLQNTTLDLSKNISTSFRGQLELFGSMVGFTKDTFKLDISKFNLGDILKVAGSNDLVKDLLNKTGLGIDLENNSLTEVIDDIAGKYLTESFKKGLSEYAYDVVKSFGVDAKDVDSLSDEEMLLTIREFADADAKVYTYIQKTRTEIVTVENGKKPSMVTTNFGSDPATSENFTYFTDRRVAKGGIEYVETQKDGTYNKNSAIYKDAKTEIYGTTKPLIDLGIWCQTGYVELGRHTISVTGLKPDTTYAYRVGNKDNKYWSDWYTFTTAPKEAKDFDILVGSDLQGSTIYSYQRISKIYDKLGDVFDKNIAFMINPGDAVDNGRNLSQYEWWLNSGAKFNASTPMVMASGNHDIKSFLPEKAGNMDYYGGLTNTDYFDKASQGEALAGFGASENAVINEYNYLYTHFNYDLPSAQNQTTGFYYSFNYSGVHITVINTNDIDNEDKLAKAQYDWLVADLEAAKDMIKVVVMHKSLYSAGSHSYDKDVIALRSQLTPIFNEKKVGLVIAGHDHTYTETYYLDGEGKKMLVNANGKNEIGDKGTLYLTMGTMGEKFYNYVSNPKVPVNTGYSLHDDNNMLSNPTFGKLSYNAKTNKLSYYGYEYIRELDELGNVTDGKIVEIKKSIDWNTLISLILVGVIFATVVIAIIASAVHNAKIRKVND
jgi:3',5'-cyclic AMP phosphodiesterase CpdA